MSEKGYSARDYLIKIDDEVIAAVTARSISRSREGIDVTSDDAEGWRLLLAAPGVKSVEISVEGVFTSGNGTDLIERWRNDTNLQAMTLEHPDGGEESGEFFVESLEHEGDTDGAVTFSCTLQSAGPVTYTAPPTP